MLPNRHHEKAEVLLYDLNQRGDREDEFPDGWRCRRRCSWRIGAEAAKISQGQLVEGRWCSLLYARWREDREKITWILDKDGETAHDCDKRNSFSLDKLWLNFRSETVEMVRF